MPVDGPQYPVNLVLSGRPVLVVGAGPVGTSKVAGLLEGGADDVTVIAPEVTATLEEMVAAGRGAIRLERRAYRSGDAARFRLVITATGVRAVDEVVHADAEAAGVWVNSADDPDRCSFTLPSRVRRGDLMVTVSTGGHSPALAVWLRRRFEAELGPEYDALLRMLSAERESLKAAGRSTEGLNWQAALDGGVLDLLRSDQPAAALELLRSCLSSSSE